MKGRDGAAHTAAVGGVAPAEAALSPTLSFPIPPPTQTPTLHTPEGETGRISPASWPLQYDYIYILIKNTLSFFTYKPYSKG